MVLAKSTHKNRIQENFNIFDFELTMKEMEDIRKLDTGKSLFFNHQDAATVDFFVQLINQRRSVRN